MKRPGFTLIELLVVIGILAVLMAITSTVSYSIRKKARATRCQLHIHQLCVGLFSYSTQNDRFPKAWAMASGQSTIGDLGHDLPAKWWFQSIGLNPKKSNIALANLQCPSNQLSGVWPLKDNILWGNYGVNWSVCASKKFVLPVEFQGTTVRSLSPTEIKNPSKVFLLGDSGYSVIGWQHVLTPAAPFLSPMSSLATSYIPGSSANRNRELHLVQQVDALEGRHPNRTLNVGFADGHVQKKEADELLVETTGEGKYINRTPLWKPR